MKHNIAELKTAIAKEADWTSEHPMPQMKRDSYISLCGEWDFYVISGSKTEALGRIQVPFVPESSLSGINQSFKKKEILVYKKKFSVSGEKNVLLHIGAVDTKAVVSINNKEVLRIEYGYIPTTADITDYITAHTNEIEISVTDTLDKCYPYGKQRKKRGGMWYTPISGIWQAVWLEEVCDNYIRSLKITPSLTTVRIETEGGADNKKLTIGKKCYSYCGNSITIDIDNPVNWTPEDPHLYDFTLECGEDRIYSYFALRTISIEKRNNKPYLCLNGEPYFFHGVLDQGYFPDGIFTPASPKGYKNDIMAMKVHGFNMLRKHIKTEPDLFYYYCDKYGMAVFQDAVNCGSYSFILDTALPTIGIKAGLVRPRRKATKKAFYETAKGMIEHLYNHPCVCYYTIFNEGWGQFEADKLYKEFKDLDPTRIYDTASGWFKTKESDVISEHIYFKKADIKPHPEKPMVLSEFGGYTCKIKDHSYNLDKSYGYKHFATTEEFTKAINKLYKNEIIPLIEKGLCAAVITQLSDIEDETNGFLTYDRKVVKMMYGMAKISTELKEKFKASLH